MPLEGYEYLRDSNKRLSFFVENRRILLKTENKNKTRKLRLGYSTIVIEASWSVIKYLSDSKISCHLGVTSYCISCFNSSGY